MVTVQQAPASSLRRDSKVKGTIMKTHLYFQKSHKSQHCARGQGGKGDEGELSSSLAAPGQQLPTSPLANQLHQTHPLAC